MPDRMSEYMSDRLPDRMPEHMSDRLHEGMSDRCQNKCQKIVRIYRTYVQIYILKFMVGITRSKVILLSVTVHVLATVWRDSSHPGLVVSLVAAMTLGLEDARAIVTLQQWSAP